MKVVGNQWIGFMEPIRVRLLRMFADHVNKSRVGVVERHHDILVKDRKSIDRIDYEDALYDYTVAAVPGSIETELNRVIETPFSRSDTWRKICTGSYASLDEADKVAIYGFARHLQLRNLETLRFIETENTRFQSGALDGHLTREEREMHEWIAASPDNAHAIFRDGALDTSLPLDVDIVTVMVCRSPVELRTTTNPTLMVSVPGESSVLGTFFDDLRTWWLSLGRYGGAFVVAGGPIGFSNCDMSAETARMINRLYFVQFMTSLSVRYLIADDSDLERDLEWAGYHLGRRTTHGARWERRP